MRILATVSDCSKMAVKRCLAPLLVGIGLTLASSPASAQVQTVVAPVWSSIDHLGVDVSTGQFHLGTSEVAIGQPGAGGLSFGRHWISSGWRDSFAGTISSASSIYTVSVGASSDSFSVSGGVFTSLQAMGSTLTYSSGTNKFTYTKRDGTVFVFNKGLATLGSVVNFWASNEGAIESIAKPDGEVITYTYVSATAGGLTAYRPQSVSNNLNFQVHFTYAIGSPNNASEVTGGYLLRTKVTGYNRSVFNCANNAHSCSDSTGANWPYITYGTEAGGVETVTDRLSQTTRYVVSSNQLTHVRLPTSSTTARITISYSSGKVSNVASNIGGPANSSYTYSDASGVRTTTHSPSSQGGPTVTKTNLTSGWVTEYWQDTSGTRKNVLTRDSNGRVTRSTRSYGEYTELTYDSRGNITQNVESPRTSSGASTITTSASYPSSCTNSKTCNQPDSTTDARGYRTDYTYSSTHGGPLTVTLPAPSGSTPVGSGTRPETRFTYADASTGVYRPASIKSCSTGSSCASASTESVQEFSYDSQRRVSLTTTRAGDSSVSLTSATTYTAQGDVATVDGPVSGAGDTGYAYYDDMRRLRASVTPDPDGGGSLQHRVSRTTYDADGNVTIVEAGYVSSPSSWGSMTVLQRIDNTYDLATYGTLAKTALSSGGNTYAVQQYGVGSGFSRCSMTRMNPNEFASLPSDACTADTAGSFGPDRVVKTVFNVYWEGTDTYDGDIGGTLRRVQNAVHNEFSGDLLGLIDAEGNKTNYTHDGFGRLLKTIYPSTTSLGDSNPNDYEQLTYDAYGRLTARRGRDGQSFSYSYDNLGRMTAVDAPGSQPDVSYAHDNFGRVTQASQSGHTITYAYDALSRITSETQAGRTVSYLYDSGGRRSRTTWPDGFYVTYEYDALGQMTAIKENGGTALASFAYDNLGQRTTLSRSNGGSTGYAYDAVSRLIDLAIDATGSANDNWTDLSYNPAGEILSTTISNSAYNHPAPSSAFTDSYFDNGLNQYTSAGGITPTYTDSRGNMTYDGTKTYTYDFSNRMTAAGSATFSYDPASRLYQAAGSSTVQFLYDGANIIAEYNSSGTLLRRYVHGPGADEPLVWFEGAGHSGSGTPDRRHLYADERGSIVAVEGSSLTKNSYDEYGVPGSGNTGRFQYTGQIWLSDAGLYHYKARAYNPEIGRFMQTDPIGYADGMNLYNYVGGDPMNGRDPSGLQNDCAGTRLRCEFEDGPGSGPAGRGEGGAGGTWHQVCAHIIGVETGGGCGWKHLPSTSTWGSDYNLPRELHFQSPTKPFESPDVSEKDQCVAAATATGMVVGGVAATGTCVVTTYGACTAGAGATTALGGFLGGGLGWAYGTMTCSSKPSRGEEIEDCRRICVSEVYEGKWGPRGIRGSGIPGNIGRCMKQCLDSRGIYDY